MLLSEFMRREGLSDADVANAVGLSAEAIRKLRFRARGTSVPVAAKIEALSRGQVRAVDLQRRPAAAAAPAPQMAREPETVP